MTERRVAVAPFGLFWLTDPLTDARLILGIAAAGISFLVAVQFLAALRRSTWHSPPPPDPALRSVKVSVIMPARNEEQDISRAIESVLAQKGVELELIVVNDHSTDRTGQIADAVAQTDPRVQVIHDPPLPPGWLGKSNAMQQASALASGDMLLFTDGDIIFERHTLATALAELKRRELDFLSLFPRMDSVSLWENIIVPSFVGGLAVLATPGIEDPRSNDALAAGAFLLAPTSVFRTIGGFEPIKGAMVDDVELARLIKSTGYRVGFRFAPEFLHVRLYKGNRHAFWGMTKNVLVGLRGRLWLAPAVVVMPAFVFWTPVYCARRVARTRCPPGCHRNDWLHHPICIDVVWPPDLSAQTAQGDAISAGRPAGVLLHGGAPLPVSRSRRGRVARQVDSGAAGRLCTTAGVTAFRRGVRT